jgi:hypothetical protein
MIRCNVVRLRQQNSYAALSMPSSSRWYRCSCRKWSVSSRLTASLTRRSACMSARPSNALPGPGPGPGPSSACAAVERQLPWLVQLSQLLPVSLLLLPPVDRYVSGLLSRATLNVTFCGVLAFLGMPLAGRAVPNGLGHAPVLPATATE